MSPSMYRVCESGTRIESCLNRGLGFNTIHGDACFTARLRLQHNSEAATSKWTAQPLTPLKRGMRAVLPSWTDAAEAPREGARHPACTWERAQQT